MIVASDLNGTLTTGSPILAIANWAEIHYSGSSPRLFKLKVMLSYLQVRFGWKSLESWSNTAMRSVLKLIQNPDQEKLDSVMSFIVENELWPKRRPEAIKLLQQLHQADAEIIIVSAAYQPAVINFAAKIAPKQIVGIGTALKISPEGLTLAEKLTVGERKWELLQARLGAHSLEFALGDTLTDLPMLKHARNPIAVYPDSELRRIAESRGWRILDDSGLNLAIEFLSR